MCYFFKLVNTKLFADINESLNTGTSHCININSTKSMICKKKLLMGKC